MIFFWTKWPMPLPKRFLLFRRRRRFHHAAMPHAARLQPGALGFLAQADGLQMGLTGGLGFGLARIVALLLGVT